ncbi:MAG: SRPBCC family protein [Candidatus Hydrogenedentota bacterium]|nr:MAG: SRPBCC family protein [Candidatus Hydrogenedentota bacterium]
MKLFCLDERQCLPISVAEAWSFFSNPNNLVEITPPSLGLEITSDTPDKMYAGLIITYRISPLLGIPMDWVTEITQVDEPHLFIDEQRFGPYRFWHHQHHFRQISGGVEIRDVVHYSLLIGLLGGLLNTLAVKKQLREIFDYRRNYLERKFGRMACKEAH